MYKYDISDNPQKHAGFTSVGENIHTSRAPATNGKERGQTEDVQISGYKVWTETAMDEE
jgi:hypothetical protein